MKNSIKKQFSKYYGDTFRPYKHQAQRSRDYYQPLIAISNILCGLGIMGLITRLINYTIANIFNQHPPAELRPLFIGIFQIITLPLLIFRIPFRTYLTNKHGWQFVLRNKNIQREIKSYNEANGDPGKREQFRKTITEKLSSYDIKCQNGSWIFANNLKKDNDGITDDLVIDELLTKSPRFLSGERIYLTLYDRETHTIPSRYVVVSKDDNNYTMCDDITEAERLIATPPAARR